MVADKAYSFNRGSIRAPFECVKIRKVAGCLFGFAGLPGYADELEMFDEGELEANPKKSIRAIMNRQIGGKDDESSCLAWIEGELYEVNTDGCVSRLTQSWWGIGTFWLAQGFVEGALHARRADSHARDEKPEEPRVTLALARKAIEFVHSITPSAVSKETDVLYIDGD